MLPRILTTIILILILVALMGCQSESLEAVTAVNEVTEEAVEPNNDPGKLVIYSGREESLIQPLIDQFTILTGIEVEIHYNDTNDMAATLLEEGEDSPADIFYAADPSGLGIVQKAQLLAELPEEIVSQVPVRFYPENYQWVGISGRARVVAYNSELLQPKDLPENLWGFTEPEWKGRIGWPPSNGSFQAMITAMRAVWGEERTSEWLVAMQANEPLVYEKNTPIVAAVAAGEIDVGFVNHYYLYRFITNEGENFPVRNYFLPGGGPGSLILVSGVGMLKNASHVENAEKFINFLLSVPSQQYFASQTFEYPLVEGVKTHPLLAPLEELDAVAVDIPVTYMTDLLGTAILLAEEDILP